MPKGGPAVFPDFLPQAAADNKRFLTSVVEFCTVRVAALLHYDLDRNSDFVNPRNRNS